MTKLSSLGLRIYGVAAFTAAIALLLGALVLHSNSRSEDAFGWVSHTQDVIITLDALEGSIIAAEVRLNGYLMTQDKSSLSGFDMAIVKAEAMMTNLTTLVADNPLQEERAVQLARVATEKAQAMVSIVQRTRTTAVSIPDPATRLRGRKLLDAVARQVDTMRNEERRLLALRTAKAQGEVAEVRMLLLYGSPVLVLLICYIAWLIRTSISRPLADLLDAVTRFGAGDRNARAATAGRSIEFNRLASAYNDMAEHLASVMDQQETRQGSVHLLSEMSHRLHAIQSEGELSEVLDCFMPQVLPELAGVLYVHNHSRNMLLRTSLWGNPQASPEMFSPASCWGLRRGQAHSIGMQGADLICAHAAGPVPVERLCEPVLAGGEVLGLLYLEGHISDEHRFRLGMLMENIALALVNENLRSRLREQSIRDPLTKLFNRRYMEEALALETARAQRSGTPLSIVMCDIDHFKRFNDGHGHQAGDILLAAVAGLLQSHFRQGDVVCRYGGEEFTVIAPGAAPALIRRRVEGLRVAIAKLTVDHGGNRLGPITMSFGIDSWSAGQDRSLSAMLGEADRALFQAKRLGRDRIEVASTTEAAEAAE